MPLYEYYCSSCKVKFELLVNHQHADDVVCTKCRSEKVRRLLSTFAFAGKGGENSGFDNLDSSIDDDRCGCGGGSCGCH